MPKTRKVGPAGSLGPRYGTVARRRYSSIISALRTPRECPRCEAVAVRRQSVGIWLCRKCGHKFTGGAYVPQTELGEISRRAERRTLVEIAEEKSKAEVEASKPAEEETLKPKRRRRRKKTAEAPQEEPQ